MTRNPGWWFALALGCAACERPTHATQPPATTAPQHGSNPDAGRDAPAVPVPMAACGDPELRFGGYAFVPASATIAASVDLGDAALQAALSALAQTTREGQRLPVGVAFALAQWPWEVPLVAATLDRVGLRPAELVYVRTPPGIPAWVVPTTCDLAVAIERVRTTFDLEVRERVDATIATPRAGTPFAFDVVFLAGDQLALCPAGHAARWLETLATHPDGAGVWPSPGGNTLGGQLETLVAAPVRAVVRGGPNLGGATRPSAGHPVLVRAGAAGVVFDVPAP